MCLFFTIQSGYSQPAPTYELRLKNVNLESIIFPNDALTFDIYLQWTNSEVSQPFQYALGQYFITFNRNAFTNYGNPIVFPTNVNDTSKYSYKIIGSDLPTNAIPRNPSFQNTTNNPPLSYPNSAVLRLASNATLGFGNGPIISSVYPGTKIVKMRLWNKQGPFDFFSFEFQWRNPPAVDLTTRILYYDQNGFSIDITDPANTFVDFYGFIYQIFLNMPIPHFNSTDNSLTTTFTWLGKDNTVSYSLKIFSDSLMNNIFFIDSTLTDTFKTVSGFGIFKKYFWIVEYKDSMNNISPGLISMFTTREALLVKVVVIPEGLYDPVSNKLSRRDTVSAYLHQITSPYSIIDSAKALMDSLSFLGLFKFKYATTDTYYISVKHFNSIETWSKIGGKNLNETLTNNYYFISDITQAYGNNLKLKGSKYCIYSGDVNQDGVIDALDFSLIDNDAFVLKMGLRLKTDLNGDNIVDADDILIADNNRMFISVIRP